MPFVETNEFANVLEPKEKTPIEDFNNVERESPAFWSETIPAAFRRENSIVSGLSQDIDPGVEASFDYVPDVEGYEEYKGRFATTYNESQEQALKANIDRERQDVKTIEDSGWLGIAASFAAGGLDPVTFIPVGGAATRVFKTGNILKGAASVARAGLISSTVSEAALHASQETRTLGESAANITAGTLLSGVLGGASGAFKQARVNKIGKSLAEIESNINEFATIPHEGPDLIVGQGITAEQAKSMNLDLPDAPLVVGEGGSVGAASRFLETNEIKTLLGSEKLKILTVGDKASPINRTLLSPNLKTREAVIVLSEQSYILEKNVRGVPTQHALETIIKSEVDVSLVKLSNTLKGAFEKFRDTGFKTSNIKDKLGLQKEKMNFSDFKKEIDIAMRNSDTSNIPEVAEAAKKLRPLVDDVYNEAISLGVAPKTKEMIIDEKASLWVSKTTDIHNELIKISEDLNAKFQLADKASLEVAKKGDSKVARKAIKEAAEAKSSFNSAQNNSDKALLIKTEAIKEAAEAKKGLSKGPKGAPSWMRRIYDNQAIMNNRSDWDARLRKWFMQQNPTQEEFSRSQPINKLKIKGLRKILKKKVETLEKFVVVKNEKFNEEVSAARVVTSKKITALKKKHFAERDNTISKIKETRDGLKRQFKESIESLRANTISKKNKTKKRGERGDLNQKLKEDITDLKRKHIAGQKNIKEKINKKINESRSELKEKTTKLFEERIETIDIIKERNQIIEFNRAFNTKIKDLKRKFKEDIKPFTKKPLDDLDIEDIVSRTTDNILGRPEDLPIFNTASSGAFKERVFDIPDSMIQDYLIQDVDVVLGGYFKKGIREIELKRGGFDDEGLRLRLEDMTQQSISDLSKIERAIKKKSLEFQKKAKSDSQVQKIIKDEKKAIAAESKKSGKQLESDKTNITGMRNRIKGTFEINSNNITLYSSFADVIKSANYVRLLGQVVLSSIGDIGQPILINGMTRTLRDQLVPFVRNLGKISKKFNSAKKTSVFAQSKQELVDMGISVELILNTRVKNFAELGSSVTGSKLSSYNAATTNAMSYLSGITAWNDTLRSFAGYSAMARILRASEAKKVSKSDVEFLARFGIGSTQLKRIGDQFKIHGTKDSGRFASGSANWTDKAAYKDFQLSIRKFTDQAILVSGQEKPFFASTTAGSVLLQFKSFALSAYSKIFIAGMQQADLAALNGAMTMVSLGMLSSYIKGTLAGREHPTSISDWIIEGVDKSGILGHMFDAHENLARAGLGIPDGPITSYKARSVASAFMGPSYSLVESTAVTAAWMTNFLKGDRPARSDIRHTRRMIPFQNVFYLRKLFDLAEEGIGNAVGATSKKTKKRNR